VAAAPEAEEEEAPPVPVQPPHARLFDAAAPERPVSLRHVRLLAARELLRLRRRPTLPLAHVGAAAGLAGWLGGVYRHPDLGVPGFQNRLGVVAISLLCFGLSALSAAGGLHADAPLLRKEARRYYHPAAFGAAKLAVDLALLRALPTLLYCAILYPLVGFQPAAPKALVFATALLLNALVAAALAAAAAVACPAPGVASLLVSLAVLQFAVFGGLLTNTAALPPGLAWLRFGSPFFFAFEAAVTAEFHGLTFDFGDFTAVIGLDGVEFSGDEVSQGALHLQPSHALPDLLCLACWLGLYSCAALALLVAAHRQRQ
jgi:hypothetical protein